MRIYSIPSSTPPPLSIAEVVLTSYTLATANPSAPLLKAKIPSIRLYLFHLFGDWLPSL